METLTTKSAAFMAFTCRSEVILHFFIWLLIESWGSGSIGGVWLHRSVQEVELAWQLCHCITTEEHFNISRTYVTSQFSWMKSTHPAFKDKHRADRICLAAINMPALQVYHNTDKRIDMEHTCLLIATPGNLWSAVHLSAYYMTSAVRDGGEIASDWPIKMLISCIRHFSGNARAKGSRLKMSRCSSIFPARFEGKE